LNFIDRKNERLTGSLIVVLGGEKSGVLPVAPEPFRVMLWRPGKRRLIRTAFDLHDILAVGRQIVVLELLECRPHKSGFTDLPGTSDNCD
jgi:hypothetical protein